MKPLPLDVAISDKRLFGAELDELESWATWLAVLKAAFALPLSEQERAIFASVAGHRAPPLRRARELWAIVGRRGGKSRVAALVACYFALFVLHKLAAGERGLCLVLAASVDQAATVFHYAKAFFESSPVLRRELEEATRSELRLRNGVTIAIHANSFRSVRGRTLLCCVFDETAFWRSEESAAPDVETYRAVLPAMMTTGGMLISISTPYRKAGLLYQKHRAHFGQEGEVLVVQGASSVFNPLLTAEALAAQRAADPEGAGAELDAEFRTDISAYIDRESVEACVSLDVRERPPMSGVRYFGFVDPSGGSSDSMTLCIGHRDRAADVVVVDALRERRPPFSPEDVVSEFCALLASYRVTRVSGDKFGGEWPAERFKVHGVNYEPAAKPKGDLYRDALALLNSRKLDLLDNAKMINQFCGLERRVARGGRDSIDHAPGAHDDLCNAVAGLAATAKRGGYVADLSWVSGDDDGDDAAKRWQAARFEQHVLGHSGFYRRHLWR